MLYSNLLCTHVHKAFLQLLFLEKGWHALSTEEKKVTSVTITAFVNWYFKNNRNNQATIYTL